MLRALTLILSLALLGAAFAHSDSKWTKGPQGGHLVDAGGGKQHWELVASGNELTLYVLDANEKTMADASACRVKGLLLPGGKTNKLEFNPAGGNVWKASGEFSAEKGMKVLITTD